ncbi:hypothetical protein H2200_003446 [Cladophialophora chaetospira]|uniref:Uncharacterized protein n=1 Tax=Cladophialophora chaetospira TaxID=386627 RepID=A0AA39CLF2_9EURO|nr:hypothetical protein H2200_003446 [Cladophialophora chaetospira]
MTNNVRTYGIAADAAIGTASIPETLVSAQWPWLALPLGLIILSLVFLVATVLKGTHRKTIVWKSSSLAVLQGLSLETHRRLGGLDHLDIMDKQASKVHVRLDEGGIDGGWRLTEVRNIDGESVTPKEKLLGLRPRS